MTEKNKQIATGVAIGVVITGGYFWMKKRRKPIGRVIPGPGYDAYQRIVS